MDTLPRIKVQITFFGPGKSVGGWDNYEDGTPDNPGTNQGYGAFGNKLTFQSCALTKPVVEFFETWGLKKFDVIGLDLGGGRYIYRNYDDRASWTNPKINARVDLYSKLLPDFASIPDGLSTPVYAFIPVGQAGLV